MSKKHQKAEKAWRRIVDHVSRGEEAIALLESIHIYDMLKRPTNTKIGEREDAQLFDIQTRLDRLFRTDGE